MPNNEKKETAVEWLVSKLSITFQTMYEDEIKQAKQMEKKQHEDTWIDSRIEIKGDGYNYIGKEKTFEEYYKQKFQNQTK
jgi:hypothetical protein